MQDVDDLDLDGEDETEPDAAPPEGQEQKLAYLEGKLKKAQNENSSLRTRLRRTEWQVEYGDFLEVVPDTLPLKEQKQLLDNLKTKFPRTEPDQAEAEKVAPKTEQTGAEKAMAAALKGSGGAESIAKTYTPEEVRRIGLKDQAEALRIIASGGMKPPE